MLTQLDREKVQVGKIVQIIYLVQDQFFKHIAYLFICFGLINRKTFNNLLNTK